MVVTRSKSAIKVSTMTKSKLGSLSSLIEKSDIEERKHSSRSIEMNLDGISNGNSHQNHFEGIFCVLNFFSIIYSNVLYF